MNKLLAVIIVVIIIGAAAIYFSLPSTPSKPQQPLNSQQEISQPTPKSTFVPTLPTSTDPAETGPETPCVSNQDCWCQSFTGADFIPGVKVPHQCNLNTNRCLACLYS